MAIPLLITRPKARAEEFADQVKRAIPGKFTPLIAPALEIRPEVGSVDLDGIQAILFTSRNAVHMFADRSTDRSIPALCVGDATCHEAQKVGLAASSANGNVAALAALAAQSYIPDLGAFLHLRGAEVAGDLAGSLMSEGIPVEERIIYDQVACPIALSAIATLEQSEKKAATVFSPRSAALLAEAIDHDKLSDLTIFSISENASVPLRGAGFTDIKVARAPQVGAIVEMLSYY